MTAAAPLGWQQREALRRRLLSLGLGELSAATVFLALAVSVVGPRWTTHQAVTLWWALGPLTVVLVQAGAYWLLARSWVGRGTMPRPVARTYRVFRVFDPVLLVLGLVMILVPGHPDPGPWLLTLAVWTFAALEYANYFLVRLSFPPTTWAREVTSWRTPRLVRDLRASDREGRH
ncbi:hypothetical protein [uncultured Serinicoccus sp.]|uniref:hypothetical protein n=1 Tax=uncultured Serinicoccus sp. TaxID=735514 RepID=UPI00262B3A22|nr:hypothetical protein [uncultured Serinicoccus sp.]